MIKYALFPNHMTEDENDCVAHVQERVMITQAELVAEMTGRGLSLTDTDIDRVYNETAHCINAHLQKGHGIVTDMFSVMPYLKGSYESKDESFNPDKHRVEFRPKLGKKIKVNHNALELQKVAVPTKSPIILEVEDHVSETVDDQVTANGFFELRGADLIINEAEADEGVFFKTGDTAIKATKYLLNTNKRVVVKVPALTAGTIYAVEIRKRYHNNKKLYTGTYGEELTAL